MLCSFSSTETMGSNHFDHNVHSINDSIRSSTITTATAGCSMDKSDKMQDAQSNKSSDNFNYFRSNIPGNSNTLDTYVTLSSNTKQHPPNYAPSNENLQSHQVSVA